MAVSFNEFSGDGAVKLVSNRTPQASLPKENNRGLFTSFKERLEPRGFGDALSDVKEGGIAIHEMFKDRAQTMHAILGAKERGEQGFAHSAFQTAGQIVGATADIAGTAVMTGGKLLLSQREEDIVRDSFTELVQGADVPFTDKDIPTLMEEYDKWAEENPTRARDVQSAASIAEFLFDIGAYKAIKGGFKRTSDALDSLTGTRTDPTTVAKEIKEGKAPSFTELAGKPDDLVERFGKSYALRNTDKVGVAEQELYKTYDELFDVKKGMRQELAATHEHVEFLRENGLEVRDPQQLLTEAHIVPEIDFGSQQFRTLDQSARLRETGKSASEAITRALEEADSRGITSSLQTARAEAKRVASTFTGVTEKQRAQILKQIDQEFDLAVEKYGTDIPLSRAQELKSNAQKNTDFAKTNADGSIENNKNKILALVYRTEIEKGMDEIGLTEFKQVNRDIGDIQVAADFLKALDGQAIPNPEYAKNMRYVAALTGASFGGVLGAAPGWYGGVILGNALRWGAVSKPTSRAILQHTKANYPDAYKQMLRDMDAADAKRVEEMLLLPAEASPMVTPPPTAP